MYIGWLSTSWMEFCLSLKHWGYFGFLFILWTLVVYSLSNWYLSLPSMDLCVFREVQYRFKKEKKRKENVDCNINLLGHHHLSITFGLKQWGTVKLHIAEFICCGLSWPCVSPTDKHPGQVHTASNTLAITSHPNSCLAYDLTISSACCTTKLCRIWIPALSFLISTYTHPNIFSPMFLAHQTHV